MNQVIQFKTTPPLLIALALVCFGLLPGAQAVVPAPDGGYGPPAYGTGNTAEGEEALLNLSTGSFNTAVGYRTLFSVRIGNFNTAVGAGALFSNTGFENTATGAGALLNNTFGNFNTANGESALFFNTTGDRNTAMGANALVENTIGYDNTASGWRALWKNTTGWWNTANGSSALTSNTIGRWNTATGQGALGKNTTGSLNTAAGEGALFFSTTGQSNTGIGEQALRDNTTGRENTAIGRQAGLNVKTAANVICIGANVGGADVSNTTWIANVYGVTTQSATTAPVVVSADGQLGTVASSERFKKDIASMEQASESILSLRPVTFHYKTDATGTAQFGLIAEEVAKVNPALVLLDKEGKPFTVRYDAVNAMLLNEFLKERKQVQDQQETIAQLKSGAAKEETARIELKSTIAQQQK
ncbi:MAG TPA: tail fiber domain-containing protein, partial [Candidatus Babeliales bacterium]|nr:tail fiber domain-containing protein [Candidatus Babeliales bacterium]